MAKRKKKSSKRERIPVIDFLIDMAAAATMDYIVYKRRQKCGGRRSNKIDPYEATGIAMGLGMIDDTEDLIKFGGVLGMMGAFDPDEPDEVYQSSYVGSHEDNPFYAPKNNKYAWRLNCEDGREYGISPEDFETRDEYHEALHREKYAWREWCEDGSELGIDPDDYETEDEYEEALEEARKSADETEGEQVFFAEKENNCEQENSAYSLLGVKENLQDETSHALARTLSDPFENDDFHVYVYCLIELSASNEKRYYRTEDRSLKKGDMVIVPDPISGETLVGNILAVEHHMRFSVPQPIKETFEIIEKR